ncbi:MAG: Bro-N domain-containing protein [Eubacteriales bacterium]
MYDIVKIFLEKDDVVSLVIEGEPLFEAKSTAKAFGFENPWKAIALNVEKDEYIKLEKDGRQIILIRESGFYSLALSSKTPEAKEFRKWAFSQKFFKDGAMECIEQLLNGGIDNE